MSDTKHINVNLELTPEYLECVLALVDMQEHYGWCNKVQHLNAMKHFLCVFYSNPLIDEQAQKILYKALMRIEALEESKYADNRLEQFYENLMDLNLSLKLFNDICRQLNCLDKSTKSKAIFAPTGDLLSFCDWAAYHIISEGILFLLIDNIGDKGRREIVAALVKYLDTTNTNK